MGKLSALTKTSPTTGSPRMKKLLAHKVPIFSAYPVVGEVLVNTPDEGYLNSPDEEVSGPLI